MSSGYAPSSEAVEFYWYTERANSRSNSPHKGAKLASYKGDPFVAGGTWHRKTEILNWSKDTEYGSKSGIKLRGYKIMRLNYFVSIKQKQWLAGNMWTIFHLKFEAQFIDMLRYQQAHGDLC